MNKKGFAMAEFGEIIFVAVIFIIVIVIGMFFIGHAEIKVNAKLSMENAAFTCKNNVVSFLQYDTDEGMPFDELIIKSYADNDYEALTRNIEVLFNKFIGHYDWKLAIFNSTDNLVTVGELDTKKKEKCIAYLPVPCRIEQDCRLKLQLELRY